MLVRENYFARCFDDVTKGNNRKTFVSLALIASLNLCTATYNIKPIIQQQERTANTQMARSLCSALLTREHSQPRPPSVSRAERKTYSFRSCYCTHALNNTLTSRNKIPQAQVAGRGDIGIHFSSNSYNHYIPTNKVVLLSCVRIGLMCVCILNFDSKF